MALSILKSVDVVSEELEILKQINVLGAMQGVDVTTERDRRARISELTALYEMKMRRYRL